MFIERVSPRAVALSTSAIAPCTHSSQIRCSQFRAAFPQYRAIFVPTSGSMAAIFIVAGLAIADKVEKKKEQKRQKKARDEARYRALQIETNERLARQNTTSSATEPSRRESTFIENPESEEEEWMNTAVDDSNPPPYEDAVAVGERREREWQEQMQRRRSSVQSNSSQGQRSADRYIRMS